MREIETECRQSENVANKRRAVHDPAERYIRVANVWQRLSLNAFKTNLGVTAAGANAPPEAQVEIMPAAQVLDGVGVRRP
jgi:hypothetical protein